MAARVDGARAVARALATGVALAAGVAAVMALVMAASGYPVGAAAAALVRGALGSPYAVVSATMVRATPLILTGLAVALAFQAGILNIGAEGQLLAGAAAATALLLGAPSLPGVLSVPAGVLAAVAGGAACAALPAWLQRRYGILEVISTIMMNFLALYLVGWLVRGPLQEPTGIYPQSPPLPAGARLPMLVPGTRLHVGFALAVLAAAAGWHALAHRASGFRLRVVGANAQAAASAGQVDVPRLRWRAFLLSGALAGVAGGVEVMGVTYALYENLSPGYGYTAIAVALLAGMRPGWVIASGLLLGALEAGAAAMQRDVGVPLVLVSVVEALLILAVVGARTLAARRPLGAGAA